VGRCIQHKAFQLNVVHPVVFVFQELMNKIVRLEQHNDLFTEIITFLE